MNIKFCSTTYFVIVMLLFCSSCKDGIEDHVSFEGHLYGFVTSSNGILEDVLVTILSSSLEQRSTTNVQGRYQFKNIPEGEYTIIFSKQNYIGSSEKITVTGSIVNEKSISLEAGETFFSVSDSLINASAIKGELVLTIESNTLWAANVSTDWLTVYQESKIGTGYLKIVWDNNAEESQNRTTEIKITAGGFEKVIPVNQSYASKIVSVRGMAGDVLTGRKSQVQIQFNGGVTIKSITSLFNYCLGEISEPSYNATGDLATFTFACGNLGYSYPFHIEWEDKLGNKFIGDFRADFFGKTLSIEGEIASRFVVPNEDTQWILTVSPSRIYHVDLSTLTILREFPWKNEGIYGPESGYGNLITLNPYNGLLYLASGHAITVLDPNTGEQKGRVLLPTVDNRPNSPYFSTEMAFNKSGMGVFVARERDSSGSTWFVIDSSNDHHIFRHPQAGWDEGQYHAIEYLKTSHDQTEIFMYATTIDGRGLVKANRSLERFSFVQAFYGTMFNRMFYNRSKDSMILSHQSDMTVIDNERSYELSNVAFHYVADFAYHNDLSTHLYLIEENSPFLSIINYENGEVERKFPIFGGQWRDIVVTLDGQYLIVESGNYGYDPTNDTFSTHLLQFPTTLFRR